MNRKIRVILTSQKTSDRLSEKKSVDFKKDLKGVELQVINIFPEVAYTSATSANLFPLAQEGSHSAGSPRSLKSQRLKTPLGKSSPW